MKGHSGKNPRYCWTSTMFSLAAKCVLVMVNFEAAERRQPKHLGSGRRQSGGRFSGVGYVDEGTPMKVSMIPETANENRVAH